MSEPVTTGKVLVDTYAGVRLIVTPLTLEARQMLLRAAKAKYPAPDKKLYEREAEGVKAFGTNAPAVIPAEENPDYIAEAERAEAAQARFMNESVILICVDHPQKEALIETRRDELAQMRAISPDEVYENDWAATVQLFLADVTVMGVINRAMPLTEGEVLEEMRFFRLELPRSDVQRTASVTQSPRPQRSN